MASMQPLLPASRYSRSRAPSSRAAALALPVLVALVTVAPAARCQQLSFADGTAGAGIDGSHGVDFAAVHAIRDYSAGGAAGDFNRDGWQDLFVLSGGGNGPDQLYINDGDGTFTDLAAEWGVATTHIGMGIAVGDFNGDGWLDVFITSAGVPDGSPGGTGPDHFKLYRNNGGASFVDVATSAGFDAATRSFGAAFGDYDLDGDLDLAVAGHGSSLLFRNNGDETFTNVTRPSGVFHASGALGFSPRFADLDGDRYPELLLVADFGESLYFENNTNGTFTPFTEDSGTGLDENGMGQTLGDFNGDGLLDWYVTSIHGGGGLWTGNKLYLNRGDHFYVEAAASSGVDDGGFGWAAVAVDFNHDGWLDLAETNGSTEKEFKDEQSYLWLNDANGRFSERALDLGFQHFGQGRGMVHLDHDNDGDQDVVIFTNQGPPVLFRNELQGADSNWLRVFLDTTNRPDLAPDGIGSTLRVTLMERSQVRQICGGDSYLSQSELSAHFGLGALTLVDELRVEWPDGGVTVLESLPANRTITVSPPAAERFVRGDCNGDGVVTGQVSDAAFLLNFNFRAGAAPSCLAACDANRDGQVLGQVTDAVYLLQHNFRGGPAPPTPFPSCGTGTTAGDRALGCNTAPPACREDP